ncbi:unnamed protein product, partial [Rotaria magnacalcarata]
MSTTIIINNDHQMNTSISITLPMIATTTTTIQFSVGHEQNNGCNFPCVHCDQHNLLLTNDMKKEKIKIKKDVSDVKDEVIDITDEVMAVKNKVIDITDEFGFDFEMDKNILHKDPNLYTTFFSPISNATSQGEENNKSSDSEDQDESCDVVLTKCLTDISEIVQYLKE